MNSLRLSIISLALALAVMTLGVSADSWAAPKCDNPPCGGGGGGGDDPIVYIAELTGAFKFKEEVTLNSKENQLKSDSDGHVTITRPESTDPFRAVWDYVFSKCPNFFVGPTPVEVSGFEAPAGKKGWTIDKPGGVRINFRNIRFPQVEFPGYLIPDSAWVNLALIGEIDFSVPFPPSKVTLIHFQIYGQTESGVTPRLACDDKNFETEDLSAPVPITLTLTLKET
jgi:hypothetical protein